MRLYHFTSPENLIGIAEHGLTPRNGGIQTAYQEVVWLTTAPTMLPNRGERAWIEARRGTIFTDAECDRFITGGFLPGSNVRLTVEVTRPGLFHYSSWLRRVRVTMPIGYAPFDNRAILASMSTASRTNWWIYFGTIRPHQIIEGLPQTAEAA